VIGNFNHWRDGQHKLFPRWDESGIWEGFFSGIPKGEAYKYAIQSNTGEYLEKADPFALYAEIPPQTASIVWQTEYTWKDQAWMNDRKKLTGKARPYSFTKYTSEVGSGKSRMATAR